MKRGNGLEVGAIEGGTLGGRGDRLRPHRRASRPVHVHRDDGGEGLALGRRRAAHDLVHWAVEDALGLERGFWGLVDAGADFGFVNASGHSGERESPSSATRPS